MQAETQNQSRAIPIKLRGFVAPLADGTWYAHFIDLTIDAQAPTREEALAKLSRAAVEYITWAVDRGEPLRRPSPLQFRLRYYVYLLRDRLKTILRRPRRPKRTFNQAVAA